MRRLLSLFAAFTALMFTTVAYADTLSFFDISLNLGRVSSSGSIGTVSGTVTIDTTVGYAVASDFFFDPSVSGPSYSFTSGSYFEQLFPTINGNAAYFGSDQSSSVFLILELPGANLVGYHGGDVCSVTNGGCGLAIGFWGEFIDPSLPGLFDVNSGSLTYTGSITEITGTLPYGGATGSSTDPPPGVTPEPSSLILLGTGLSGVVAAARRRLRA